MATTFVFLAMSLDGYIAGDNNDLSWLPQGSSETVSESTIGAVSFEQVLAETGCMLMGRTTFDVVTGFGPEMWAYGDVPIVVATRKAFTCQRTSVQAKSGTIQELVSHAKGIASPGKKVYLDGGNIVQQALQAGLVDELMITVVPKMIGSGVKLFPSPGAIANLELVGQKEMGGGMVLLKYKVLHKKN
mmetsp:Transcript_17448/g.28173  ORF Transcript_17448/g.28173 Transcript_17448/m.28173 type:complete len:188 (+) Transcript_17448:245-808(+)